MKLPSIPFPVFSPGRLLRAAACFLFASSALVHSQDILWTFGTTVPGTAAPVSLPANLTVSDVAQGNNNGTTALLSEGSASSADYPGASKSFNAQMATPGGVYEQTTSGYFEITLTPSANYRVTLTELSFGTRRTNTGPQAYTIRTSADSYATALAGGSLPGASTWGYIANPGLNVTSATPLIVRLYGTDGSGSISVNTAVWRIDDLKLSVVVAQDGAPSPAITDVSPLSGTVGTPVTITGTNFGDAPAVRFHGTLASGSTVNAEGTSITVDVPAGTSTGPGPVTVTTSGGAASGPQPFDVIPQPAITLFFNPDTVLENAANPAASGTITIPNSLGQNLIVSLTNDQTASLVVPPSVSIPAGETSANFNVTVIPNPASFADVSANFTASASGHDQGTAILRVQNTDALPTSVVINKYLNSSPDIIELLVIGDGNPGSTADLRRMVIKDYSASMANDGGGKFRFNDSGAAAALFSALKAGTLVVLTNSGSSPDTDPADFVVRLGLTDNTYFSSEGGTFDIATTEMVMIKGQDATAGTGTGAIHTLAGGVEGTQFTSAPPQKLLAAGTSSTGNGIIANNSTSSLADYNGTDATGAVPLTAAAFGLANNNNNNSYIRALRGISSVDGAGIAAITNETAASPFLGKNYFPRNAAGQTVSVNLISNAGPGAVSGIKITVPASFGVPVEASISISGVGAGNPAISVTGQEISITGAAITLTDAAAVAIAGLTSPNPSAVTDDGRYAFNVQTSGGAGVLTDIAAQPFSLVSIPVSSLRDVDANGVPLDAGKTVAISAVCTEENFNPTGTSAYVQDGDSGINIFISGTDLALARGTRYAIIGQVIQFSGLTEISPASAASVIPLGPDTEPAPLIIPIPDLLANAEAYEGRLVKVTALNYVSGIWGSAQTVGAADAAANPVDIRIQAGSSAAATPSWPASITGIFGQFDSTSPFTSGYQIMPRTDADVESFGGGAGYDGWAAAYPGIGSATDDGDGDGVSNLLEYAGGSIPNDGKSLPQTAQSLIGTTLTVVWAKGAQAAADLNLAWTIEASPTMAVGTWSTTGVLNLQDGPTSISGDYVIEPGTPKAFLRLKVVRTP
jgi:hypothetical protein